MSNQPTEMSRRDWFRLRAPAATHAAKPKLGGDEQAGMQKADEPVNHGGVDLSSLPPMHKATLDNDDVTWLFADLEKHATAVHLMAARNGKGNPADQSNRLSTARDQLLNGNVKKLQIRYQWDDARWIDTLQQTGNGFRLVRIQHI